MRAPIEPREEKVHRFYERLLAALKRSELRDGDWQLLDCVPAWDGNWTSSGFLTWTWRGSGGTRLIVAVNYADHQSQGYVRLPFDELGGRTVRLADLMSPATYDRSGSELVSRGLYLDLPAWGYHVFDVTTV